MDTLIDECTQKKLAKSSNFFIWVHLSGKYFPLTKYPPPTNEWVNRRRKKLVCFPSSFQTNVTMLSRGVYFSVWGGGQKYGQMICWGKKIIKGDEKRGKMHIFSPIGKKYAYFFPNWLKIFKMAKKGWKFYIKSHLGKNIKKGGGGKIWISNLIYIHPWYCHKCLLFYLYIYFYLFSPSLYEDFHLKDTFINLFCTFHGHFSRSGKKGYWAGFWRAFFWSRETPTPKTPHIFSATRNLKAPPQELWNISQRRKLEKILSLCGHGVTCRDLPRSQKCQRLIWMDLDERQQIVLYLKWPKSLLDLEVSQYYPPVNQPVNQTWLTVNQKYPGQMESDVSQ